MNLYYIVSTLTILQSQSKRFFPHVEHPAHAPDSSYFCIGDTFNEAAFKTLVSKKHKTLLCSLLLLSTLLCSFSLYLHPVACETRLTSSASECEKTTFCFQPPLSVGLVLTTH